LATVGGLATVGAREGAVASVTAAGSVFVGGLATVVAPGVPVEVERQTRSRESVGAVMCVVQASAVPRAGAAVATAVAAVAPAVVGEASTGAGAVVEAGASRVAGAAVGAGAFTGAGAVAGAEAGAAVVVAGVDEA
jgi:hypothetical protein